MEEDDVTPLVGEGLLLRDEEGQCELQATSTPTVREHNHFGPLHTVTPVTDAVHYDDDGDQPRTQDAQVQQREVATHSKSQQVLVIFSTNVRTLLGEDLVTHNDARDEKDHALDGKRDILPEHFQ